MTNPYASPSDQPRIPFLCRIGWHKWDKEGVNLRDVRTCQQCGRKEVLRADEGGWTSGQWDEVEGED